MTRPSLASPPLSQPLEQLLCFAIYSTGLSFNRLYKPMLDKLGLTYPQYLVLLLLRDMPDMSISALGEQLFLESNTITPLIKRMEANGIVTRRRDKTDERIVRVALTKAGQKLSEEATCIPHEILEATGHNSAGLNAIRDKLLELRESIRTNIV